MGIFSKADRAFDESDKYFYNIATGEVEQGRQSPGANRMGPYDTREEAQQALAKAQQRNDAADAAEEEWNPRD